MPTSSGRDQMAEDIDPVVRIESHAYRRQPYPVTLAKTRRLRTSPTIVQLAPPMDEEGNSWPGVWRDCQALTPWLEKLHQDEHHKK